MSRGNKPQERKHQPGSSETEMLSIPLILLELFLYFVCHLQSSEYVIFQIHSYLELILCVDRNIFFFVTYDYDVIVTTDTRIHLTVTSDENTQ